MAKSGAILRAYLLTVKSLEEFTEVPLSVMWPGRSLRMVLDSENRGLPVTYSFDCAIIEVKVRDLK